MISPQSDTTDRHVSSKPKSDQTSWYAKLHPIGMSQQTKAPKRPLNLSIFFRVWLAVALIFIICGVVVFTQLFSYVKPTVQQVIEDTLLDTSKVLAVSLQIPLRSGQLYRESYQTQLDSAFIGTLAVDERSHLRYQGEPYSSFRVYITDNEGIVIYDSQPAPHNAEGEDYSHWNDIYLTLKGSYSARNTVKDNYQQDSAMMYVAQPITDSVGKSIGVVSVGKPVASVLPYLDNTRQRMLFAALLISAVALILAGLVAWWLKQSMTLVTQYTSALAEDTKKPYFYLGRELNGLTDTIETMKHRLENRAYVSDYVHTLTHELKSPLTAIRASGELLEDNELDDEDKQMLIQTVSEQSIKIQQLIDRLLLLAKVEQPTFKLNRQLTPLLPLLQSLIKDNTAKLQQQQLLPITIHINNKRITSTTSMQANFLEKTSVYADGFWLVQALQNILDNAIHFAENSVTINISTTSLHSVTIAIFNDGKLLPDYAVAKVFDRYFSLSHQSISNKSQSHQDASQPQVGIARNTPKKGTGLGLTLVKQVIEHHSGHVIINNVVASNVITSNIFTDLPARQSDGVVVSITLPLASDF